MASRKLTIEIAGDASGAGKAFATVEDKGSKMGSIFEGVGQRIGQHLLDMGTNLLQLVPSILTTGGKLEALGKKAETVFEDSLSQVENWSKKNAAAMGLTTASATGLAAGIGDLLKPMGFTAKQAAGMSTDLLNLSGALSAWSGGTVDAAGVSDIMTKALLGETDGLKSLGISISAAEVDAVLAAKGQDKLTGAALAQAKALATQQLIMEKSTDAQKAWADGSMDSMKAQNQTKASLDQLKETLIQAVYPALQGLVPIVAKVAEVLKDVIGWLSDHKEVLLIIAAAIATALVPATYAWATSLFVAGGALEFLTSPITLIVIGIAALAAGVIYAYTHWEWFKTTIDAVKTFIVDDLIPAFQAIWSFINDKIIPIISTIIEWALKPLILQFELVKAVITDVLIPAFEAVRDFIQSKVIPIVVAIADTFSSVATTVSGVIDSIVGFVTAIPGRISAVVSTLWDGIKTGITAAKDWVSDRIDDVVNLALNLPGRIAGFFDGMWDGIKNAFKSAINTIIGWWNGLEFRVPGVHIPGTDTDVGGFTLGMPDIPKLHSGGTVNFGPAGQGLALLRNNETVVTPEAGPAGGVVINLYIAGSVQTERDLIRAVADGIVDGQRRGEITAGFLVSP